MADVEPGGQTLCTVDVLASQDAEGLVGGGTVFGNAVAVGRAMRLVSVKSVEHVAVSSGCVVVDIGISGARAATEIGVVVDAVICGRCRRDHLQWLKAYLAVGRNGERRWVDALDAAKSEKFFFGIENHDGTGEMLMWEKQVLVRGTVSRRVEGGARLCATVND